MRDAGRGAPASPAQAYRLGEVQERYRFLAKLGSGGMADVFLGIQQGAEDFKRLVVIKRIHASWLEQEEGLRMFLDEARLVASLNHPHIVKIFDLSWMGRDICITMEYIDGESLAYVRRACKKHGHTIPLPVICKLMVEAAEALQYAHSAKTPDGKPLNLVHRDIGPQNLLLDANGYLKVIDFGIAKSANQTELTSPGMLKGKLPYMAPDLFTQTTIDGRLDIYALGLVFHEMLTLRQAFPFRKDVSVAEVMQRVTNEPLPPVSSLMPGLDPGLDVILAKATHKDRDQRYPNGAALAADIVKFAERCGGVATTAQVEEWFQQTFRDRIAQRRDFERLAMQRAEQPYSANAIAEGPTGFTSRTGELRPGSDPSISSGSIPNYPSVEGRRFNPYLFATLVFAMVIGGAFVFRALFWQEPEAVLDSRVNVDGISDNVYARSDPPGADIYVNGRLFGNTGSSGLNFRVEPNRSHELVLRLEGYDDYALMVPGESFGQRRIMAQLVPVRSEFTPEAVTSRKKPTRKRRPKPANRKAALAADAEPTPDADTAIDTEVIDAVANGEGAAEVVAATETVAAAEANLVEEATALVPRPPPPAPRLQADGPQGPVYQSLNDVLKRRVAGEQPQYPRVARSKGRETMLSVRVRINREGLIADHEFVDGDPLFHKEVSRALRSWRFRPHRIGGEPVETYAVLKFGFKLQ